MNVGKIQNHSYSNKTAKIGAKAGALATGAYFAYCGKDIYKVINSAKKAGTLTLNKKLKLTGLYGGIAAGVVAAGALLGKVVGKIVENHKMKQAKEQLKDSIKTAVDNGEANKISYDDFFADSDDNENEEIVSQDNSNDEELCNLVNTPVGCVARR